VKFIDSANVESEAAEYGVGIVKLMGRYCGYIAVASSLASRDVNICLIPEVHFQLEGEDGVYEAIIERAKVKGHCVIVVAEGAEDGMIPEERERMREKLGIGKDDVRKDESGNVKNVDIGAYIKGDLAKYASEKHNIKLTVKYLDPMYAIRTVPANCDDTVLCSRLGTVAVHGILGGFTDFSVGLVRDEPVMIPVDILVEAGSKKMKRKDYEW
jgi:6-phosphofructokinase 1